MLLLNEFCSNFLSVISAGYTELEGIWFHSRELFVLRAEQTSAQISLGLMTQICVCTWKILPRLYVENIFCFLYLVNKQKMQPTSFFQNNDFYIQGSFRKKKEKALPFFLFYAWYIIILVLRSNCSQKKGKFRLARGKNHESHDEKRKQKTNEVPSSSRIILVFIKYTCVKKWKKRVRGRFDPAEINAGQTAHWSVLITSRCSIGAFCVGLQVSLDWVPVW
jgi:hypothetical protein